MDTSINSPVEYKNNLRIKCFFEKISGIRRHYHRSIVLYFVLKGDIIFYVNGEKKKLNQNDLLLVNSNDIHEAYSSNSATLAVLEFDPSIVPGNNNLSFNLYSQESNYSAEEYNQVRIYMAKLIKAFALQDTQLNVLAVFFDFLSYINSHFKSNSFSTAAEGTKYNERIKSIADYIAQNYKKGISLKDVAAHEYLSTSYLSTFFDKYFGKSFYEYYNNVRLNSALHQLLTTKDSISDIALDNGFSDSRSFVHVFKEKYKKLPSVYRKEQSFTTNPGSYANESKLTNDEISESVNYLNQFHEMSFKEKTAIKKSTQEAIALKPINLSSSGTKVNNCINEMVNVSSAADLLIGEIQNELTTLNKKMHFKYITLCNIFGDALDIYGIDINGSSTYSFVLIDKILDFVLSIGIKPFLQLSFIPRGLAKNPNNYIINGRFLISYPKDMKKWCELIDEFFDHIIARYGYDEVNSWLYSIWDSPESGPQMFGFENDDRFNIFYNITFKQIKKNLPKAKIGCSSFVLKDENNSTWLKSFLSYCKKENIKFDFVPVQYFSEKINSYSSFVQNNANPTFYLEENHYIDVLNSTEKLLSDFGYGNLPIYMIAFNFCMSQKQLLNDTCFASSFFVKNYLETVDKVKSFSTRYLKDSSRITKTDNELYYGGSGLINITGVPKSTYNVLLLLNKLDDEVLAKGNGYYITKGHNKIHILLYYYLHYSHFLADGEFIINTHDRYSSFDLSKTLHFETTFENIQSKKCIIKNYVINCNHGSSYDTFVSMGGITQKTSEELEYLKQMSLPGLSIKEQPIRSSQLKVSCDLDAFEVRLIEISY